MPQSTPPYVPLFGTGAPAMVAPNGTLYFDTANNYKIYIRKVGVWNAAQAPSPLGQIIGTNTNDNAATGNVGEIIESEILTGGEILLTTGIVANITSILLTPGDWDVWGNLATDAGGSTLITNIQGGFSTVSATIPPRPNKGGYILNVFNNIAGSNYVLYAGKMRISIAINTTIYLVISSGFSVNTCSAYGYIGARRVR